MSFTPFLLSLKSNFRLMRWITTIFPLKLKEDSKDHNIPLNKEDSILIFFKLTKSLKSRNIKGQLTIAIKNLLVLFVGSFMLLFRQNKNNSLNQNMENSSLAGPFSLSSWPIWSIASLVSYSTLSKLVLWIRWEQRFNNILRRSREPKTRT
jgi:hypothetical protein